ncbi:hypothetical protein DE146DRAFT_629420 [Phaeosphaeria sp. MPI-PUGE-AT-0046c]|nr:hypothetical protein DE146DRAFT_629420 [Phaeosphaeria sp. MPI-PUGE-AT-0046c]
MRIAFAIGALVALAAAAPYPQDDSSDDPKEEPITIDLPFPTPTVPAVVTTSLNIPATTVPDLPDLPDLPTKTRSKKPHWEPIPIFTKECKCDTATVAYPCWATDSLQRCNYEEIFSYGCYMSAAGGCPTPTRVCKELFKPTPKTGRHPCDFGGPRPEITPAPSLTPVLPTGNITLPVVPTSNVSLPVLPTANVSLPVTLPL